MPNALTPARRRGWLVAAAVAATLALSGCENKSETAAAPLAAKVNDDVITVPQIEHVVQQQRGLKPEQAEAASRVVLQRLVEQQLAVQRAQQLKLDREPRVLQQLDAARREVLARAYFDKAGEAAAKPGAEELARYYEEHPALFAQRRIYSLQEFQIEARPEQVASLKAQLTQAKNIDQFIEVLKANDLRFSGAQAVRSAEQLPIASLGTFAAMKDGQAVLNATPGPADRAGRLARAAGDAATGDAGDRAVLAQCAKARVGGRGVEVAARCGAHRVPRRLRRRRRGGGQHACAGGAELRPGGFGRGQRAALRRRAPRRRGGAQRGV